MDWIHIVLAIMLKMILVRSQGCTSMENIGFFKVQTGLHYPFLTLQACLKACLVTPSCKAVNYARIQRACYIIENHIKKPALPNDCCELHMKTKGPCPLEHPLGSVFKNTKHHSLLGKRDLLSQNKHHDNKGKSLDDETNKAFMKIDERAIDFDGPTSHGPHFMLVNNKGTPTVATPLLDSKNTIPYTKEAKMETTIEATTASTTGSRTRTTYNNKTMSLSGTVPKTDVTQAETRFVSGRPILNASGTDQTVTPRFGENLGGSTTKFNVEYNDNEVEEKRVIVDKKNLTPVHYEAPCKQNVTVMELRGRLNQLGGQDVGMTMTSKECQDWCKHHARCVTVDYNLWEQSCWWHWTVGLARNNTCCTQHRKRETCQYDCFDVYHGYVLNDTNSKMYEKIHISRCRKECLESENCTAFVYSNATAACWLYDFDITLLTASKEPQSGALFSVKKACYGSAKDLNIYISTTTQVLTFANFTFPTIPTTLPPSINSGGTRPSDPAFVMSPSSVVVLSGCSLVLLVGIATLIGFMLHRRREKRALEASFAHPVIWMNDYGNFSSRGQHNFWYPDGTCAEFSQPGVAINPAFQADDFPVGRTSAEFNMMATNGRSLQPQATRVTRTRSYNDGFSEPSPSTYPTFPLRPIRVAVPSTASASSPVMTSSTNAHAQSGYTTFSSSQTQADGRRLPRYEINHGMNGMDDDQNTFRCAYP